MTPMHLSKEGLEAVCVAQFFLKLLNQIKGSIEINKYYLQDLRRSITSNERKLQVEVA